MTTIGAFGVFAEVSITVEQDTTFDGEAGHNSRTFTYSQIFRATKNGTYTATGGGYDDDGTPGTVTPLSGSTADAFSYYLTTSTDSTQIGELGSWVAAVAGTPAHWEKAQGNLWFNLTPSADGSQYTVSWANSNTDTDTAQAAAQWLASNYTALSNGSLSWDSNNTQWSATGMPEGYYLLASDTGKNLIAATTDISIKEKNSYPPLDKTQADEDNTNQNDNDRSVAVGDSLDYEVKVTIPKTAKVGDKILVWDKASDGLTYNNDVDVKNGSNTGNATISDTATSDLDPTWAWSKVITVVDGSQGTDVVFTFSMTVNSDAVVDSDKENESGLKYGTGSGTTPWPYESKPDKVLYKIYYAGIEKVDGNTTTTKLANVEFTLKEGNSEFTVSRPAGKNYYVYDANGSSTVVTDTNGNIRIRGLDSDKKYTLTETKNPNNGYNLLAEPVELTLYEDTTTTITYTPATRYDANETYYTNSGDTYTQVTVDETTFNANPGTYYTKSTSSSTSSYDGRTNDSWQDVLNFKGGVLPSTGGMGTTIFYIIGVILLAGAAIVLVTRRRMNAE